MCAARSTSDEYEALIDDIIETAVDTMGEERALSQARGIDEIQMSNGSIDRLQGDPREATEALAQAYIDQLGMASKVALKAVASDYEGRIDIPDNIS